MISLFSPLNVGALQMPHRVVMAPMTRSRSAQPGNVPTELMATYYAQRASAGFIVSEATQISPQGQGYSFTPGIHSLEQVAGWRGVTKAVHAAGGRMVLQLWHVGRMSHPVFQGGQLPVAPSALAPRAQVWIADEHGQGRMVECPIPRALAPHEIAALIEDYQQAALNAKAAGFDGVEIHGANGYLIDSFLRSSSNHREDGYGGSINNRLRFLDEVVDAVVEVMGEARVGVRLSPHITQRGMDCPERIPTALAAARLLSRKRVAYLHLAEADWDDAPAVPDDFRRDLRRAFDGAIGVAGGYTLEKAQEVIRSGRVDWVAFGRPFIANPDLPRRLERGSTLAEPDPATLFGGDACGYTDYPRLQRRGPVSVTPASSASTMKAVAFQQPLPASDPLSLQDVELPAPQVSGRDLLVDVEAVSVNPVDVKVRASRQPSNGQWEVIGWDAAGVVRAVGPEVQFFKPGDRVWYAGDITRAGSYAEQQLVDERLVGRMPRSLDFAEAAALPLTSITAWELLFDRLGVLPGKQYRGESLLIIGAAGGVGSILTQLARQLTSLTVIGTASRPETRSWVMELGAHHVIDHSQPLSKELARIGLPEVTHVASLTQTDQHFEEIVKSLAPQGRLALIDDPAGPLDIRQLKRKSLSLHWELMFTRSLFKTADMEAQHRLLEEVAQLVDVGVIRSTVAEQLGSINATNLRRAHELIESGRSRGKVVLAGF